MRLKDYTKKMAESVAIIEKLWGDLLWSFDKCSIPVSEANLFGLVTIAFEGYIKEVKDLSEKLANFSSKEKFGEQILEAATAAAILLRYISKTASSEDIVVKTKKGWIEREAKSVIFDIIEDTQNLILGE